MSDEIVTLNFSGDQLDASGGVWGHISSGTVQVDYSTNGGQGSILSANITIQPNSGNPFSFSASDLTISNNSGQYSIFGTPGSTNVTNPDGGTTSTYPNGGVFLAWNTITPPLIGATVATPGASSTYNPSTNTTNFTGTFASTPSNSAESGINAFIFAPVTYHVDSVGPVCFTSGTRIRTEHGEVAVEDLKVGDLVVTSSGSSRPIVWLGHRKIRCASRENPRDAWPVRVSAGAFGEGKPERDLYLSPGHAICVDCVGEVLIPVGKLVNGATITREVRETIDYWHVELESHDVLFAEGLEAESYINVDNRLFFAGDLASAPDAAHGLEDYCRPFVEGGPVLGAVRAQLEARAEALGSSRMGAPDFRLVVDGTVQPPLASGNAAVFLLPRDARDVRLVAKTFVPADDRGSSGDARALGLCLYGISFSDGETMIRVARDDTRLDAGCHDIEASLRWTKAELRLDRSLWSELKGEQILLRVDHDAGTLRGWASPAGANAQESPALLRLIA
jgi:Hint domain